MAGSFTFTAKAYDNDGASTVSDPVSVTVDAPNTPPTVSLTSPANGASFLGGAQVTLSANASDSDGTVARVDFYVDGSLLGSDTSSTYTQTWVAEPGSHVLRAIAIDDDATSSTPSDVTITVPIPPPTRTYTYNSYQELCRVQEPETGATLNFAEVYARQPYTLVYFFPKADTPGCTKQGCSLRDAYEALTKKGVAVIGVSHDEVAEQKAFKEKYHLPFTLIAGHDDKVIEAFGVPHIMATSLAERQAYLIKDGKVVWADYSASTDKQAADVLAVLAAQKS